MSGTVSYDVAHLRPLVYDDVQFVNLYIDFITGKRTNYVMGELHSILTGIDIFDDYYGNKTVDLNDIINSDSNSTKEIIIIGRNKLSSLLQDSTIRHYISITNQYNILLRIIESMNRGLPDDILQNILDYMQSISPDETLSKEMINNAFKSVEFTREHNNPYHIFQSMKSLMYDQMAHFKSKEIDCNIWHIDCKHNNYELGSICVFYNSKNPMIFNGKKGLMIQDIVKYPIPFLVQFLFPNYNGFIPKLNTVLETPINMIASSVGIDYIFVRPINNQGAILIKFYGYKETDAKLTYPCETISVGFETWLYKEIEKSYL